MTLHTTLENARFSDTRYDTYIFPSNCKITAGNTARARQVHSPVLYALPIFDARCHVSIGPRWQRAHQTEWHAIQAQPRKEKGRSSHQFARPYTT
jgi:hypothetical protein